MSIQNLQAALRHQDAIQAALATRSQEELVQIAADLVKTYVIDGVTAQKVDVGRVHVPQQIRGLSFAALIEVLKFHLDLKELELFTVSNGQVFVKLGNREFALDGSSGPSPVTAPAPPPAAPTPRAAPASGSAASPPPAPAARPAGIVESSPRVRTEVQRPFEGGAQESDERFRMLELD
ncbi:MAG: hypothetical protein IV100_18275 [Myxococcales bacterium]|nr:hypothetical protein [Myxococcales bacterium]